MLNVCNGSKADIRLRPYAAPVRTCHGFYRTVRPAGTSSIGGKRNAAGNEGRERTVIHPLGGNVQYPPPQTPGLLPLAAVFAHVFGGQALDVVKPGPVLSLLPGGKSRHN